MRLLLPHPRRLREREAGVVRRTNRRSAWDAEYLLDDYLHHRELRYEVFREQPIGPIRTALASEALSEEEIRLFGGRRPRASALVHRRECWVLYESAIVADSRNLDLLDRNARLLPESQDLPEAAKLPIRKRLLCVFCSPSFREKARERGIEVVPYQPAWTRGLWPSHEVRRPAPPQPRGPQPSASS